MNFLLWLCFAHSVLGFMTLTGYYFEKIIWDLKFRLWLVLNSGSWGHWLWWDAKNSNIRLGFWLRGLSYLGPKGSCKVGVTPLSLLQILFVFGVRGKWIILHLCPFQKASIYVIYSELVLHTFTIIKSEKWLSWIRISERFSEGLVWSLQSLL